VTDTAFTTKLSTETIMSGRLLLLTTTIVLFILFITIVQIHAATADENHDMIADQHHIEAAKENIEEAKQALKDSEDLDIQVNAKDGSISLVLLKTMSDSYDEVDSEKNSLAHLIAHYTIISEEIELLNQMNDILRVSKSEKLKSKMLPVTEQLLESLTEDVKEVKQLILDTKKSLTDSSIVFDKSIKDYFSSKNRSQQLTDEDRGNMELVLKQAQEVILSADKIQ
jgi:hypothetical protein